jgi:hypothetical protein
MCVLYPRERFGSREFGKKFFDVDGERAFKVFDIEKEIQFLFDVEGLLLGLALGIGP